MKKILKDLVIAILLLTIAFTTKAQNFTSISNGLQNPGDGVFHVNGHTFVSTCNPMYLYEITDTTLTEIARSNNLGRINQIRYDQMQDEYILIGQFHELINMLGDTVQCDGIASFNRITNTITAMGVGINCNFEYFYDGILSPNSDEVILQGRFAIQTPSDTAYNAVKINLQSHAYSSFNTTLFNKNMDVPRRLVSYNNQLYGTGSYMLNGQSCLIALLDSAGYHPILSNFHGLVMDVVEIPAGLILVGSGVKSNPLQTRTDVVLFDGVNFSLYCQISGTVFTVDFLQNNLYFGGQIDSLIYGTQSIAVKNFCAIMNGMASDCGGGVTSLSQTAYVANIVTVPIENSLYLAGVFDNVGNNVTKFTPAVVNTGIQSSEAVNKFTVYPNPAKDYINIKTTQSGIVRIMDMTGRVVLEGNVIVGENRIELQNLKTGLYIVQIGGEKKIIRVSMGQ